MWRFKPSKFKNAAPKVPQCNEGWVTDISVSTPNSCGNHIQASAAFVAFNIDAGGGGSLGLVSSDNFGSQRQGLHQLNAHSGAIVDFDFCPYDDGILATGSQDHHVKLWRIQPESSLPTNSIVDFSLENRLEALKFHPLTDCVLTTVDDRHIRLWDVNKKQQIYGSCHDDAVQGLSWKSDGKLLASCGKDKILRIWDPRQPTLSQMTESHCNNRDARVIWLGDSAQVLTTGFGNGRERELIVRDLKKFDIPVFTHTGESSLGVWIPLFDCDTNMLFLVGKADTAVSFWEVLDREPYLQEVSKYMGSIQAKGAALMSKRGLKVMQGEVNRVLLLGANCIVPISYIVPRKSYRDFHSDLFPDTHFPEPTMTVEQWTSGENIKLGKMSLNPTDKMPLLKLQHELGSGPVKKVDAIQAEKLNSLDAINETSSKQTGQSVVLQNVKQYEQQSENAQKPVIPPRPVSPRVAVKSEVISSTVSSAQDIKCSFLSSREGDSNKDEVPKPKHSPSPQKPARSFGIRVSKFRHLNGVVLQNDTSITDVSSLTRTVPGDSNGFEANDKFIALPLGAAGNFVAVFEVPMSGRAPPLADTPGVLCGTKCMDFTWDPFDSSRLVTACDTGDIQVWKIEENFKQRISEPSSSFKACADKVNILKFHPCAEDILCIAGSDFFVHVWDLHSGEEKLSLTGHKDQVLAMAWNPAGQHLVTVCKDQKIRLYDPRMQVSPLSEGSGPEGIRGARVVWVLKGSHFVVSGFNKVSERQIYLYDSKDISNYIGSHGMDVSPATLIPHYDEDSSTLFLTGKGDSTVYAFEVATDSPYFHPLSHFKCSGPHQTLSFLPKSICNVKEVEFARAVRLTTASIEALSFHVPRLRMEYFQDDLFPDTRITWLPTMSSEEWLSGQNKVPQFKCMQPPDMSPLSTAPPVVKTTASNKTSEVAATNDFEGEPFFESSLNFLQDSKQKEEKIIQSMLSQCQFQQTSLPQDSFDGVDPEEWDEDGTAVEQN